MFTAGFLFEVFLGGIIAVAIIPVINLVMFVARERHQPDVGIEIPIQASAARTSKPSAGTQSLVTKKRNVPHYVASNGVIITPNIEFGRRPTDPRMANHPHSEYWAYGELAFYA